MINYYLIYSTYAQYIKLCNKQDECYEDTYCNYLSSCVDCNKITPTKCDALNDDCCSNEFLKQCHDNPHMCNNNNNVITKTSNFGYGFLTTFTIFTISYLIGGCYYNKYAKKKSGLDVIPNLDFWSNLKGLVKDGISFSISYIKR